jgi:hypothetical protein
VQTGDQYEQKQEPNGRGCDQDEVKAVVQRMSIYLPWRTKLFASTQLRTEL